MLNRLLRLRRARGDVRAVQRGPKAVGKRAARRQGHRMVRRFFR